MTEEKTRVKDLVTELDVASKDMLRALRDLGLPAKSTAASVSQEDAARIRDYFVSRKNDIVETATARPNVIVRRRRKETPPPPQAEAAPAVEAEEKRETSAPSEGMPAQAESPRPAEAPRRKEAKPARHAEKQKKVVINVDARVISRPGDIKPEEEKPEPEKPAPKGKTLAQEIREAEAARLREREEARLAEKERLSAPARIVVLERPEEKAEPEPQEPEKPAPVIEKPEAEPENVPVEPEIVEPEVVKPEVVEPLEPEIVASEEPKPAPARREEKIPRVRVISRPVFQRRETPPRDDRPRSGDERRPPRTGFRAGPAQAGNFASREPQPVPGQEVEGREGQSKKKRMKGRRTVDFQQSGFGRHPEEDENMRMNRGKPRRKTPKAQPQPQKTQPVKAAKRKIRVTEAIRVADMAHQLGVKANEIIKVLFGLGVMATINQFLDIDTAAVVASEFGYEVEKAGFSEDDYLAPKEADSPESLKTRPPVVTIMGHVDHGKTSLLDAIRKSNVTSGEAGGITQHIGAYHVKTKRGEIVFLDTPGHEAFTAMRARGAQITDLVILVVAADDGVMEQTREAVSHSRAANVPIMVAVNKIDKPGADPDRVLRELAELGLQPEDWGGETIVAKVSAKTRVGLDDLLELVALQSEIMDLKANPDKPARGHIVEARLDKGRGPVATVLIQEGTLRQGDNFVCGSFAGRVRALSNDQGKKVKEAGPSIPVEVQGFEGVPEAGEEFLVVADERVARRIADSRAIKRREKNLSTGTKVTLETFLAQHDDKEALTLNLVIKADVQGSLEAIGDALQKQSTDKVKINIVHGGTGAISESDILLAAASRAIIIGFNVRPTARIKDIAERENVDIRFYDIIYKLVDDVKSAMAGLLAPVAREVYLGQAEIRRVINVPKVGVIAGSYVTDGKITRNANARILRDGVVIYTGKIASLKHFKDDAREVVKGNECGISLENFQDIKEGDIIEAFETVQEAATL